MGSTIDRAVSVAGSSLDFSLKKWETLVWPLAKIYAVEFLLIMVVGALAAGLAFMAIGGAAAELLDPVIAIVLIFIMISLLVIPLAIFSRAVSMVSYRAIDSVDRGGKGDVPIIAGAREMLVPVAVYSLVMFGAFVGALVILGGLFAIALFSFPLAGIFLLPPFFLLFMAFALVISFLFQFAPLEIALKGAGGTEALRKSASLVRANLGLTIVFDIIVFFISIAVGVVFSLVSQVLSMLFAVAAIVPGLFIVLMAVMMVLFFVQSIATGILIVPLMYRFWKSLGGKK